MGCLYPVSTADSSLLSRTNTELLFSACLKVRVNSQGLLWCWLNRKGYCPLSVVVGSFLQFPSLRRRTNKIGKIHCFQRKSPHASVESIDVKMIGCVNLFYVLKIQLLSQSQIKCYKFFGTILPMDFLI